MNYSSQDGLWQLQLWLLSTMDVAPDMLNQALHLLGASEAEMAAAREKMAGLGFGTIGETADLYRQILGSPLLVERINNSTVSISFRDSISLHFRLPLWPEFDFVVNERPDGGSWGHRFERSHGSFPPRLTSLSDLRSWKFLKKEIIEHFGEPESEDGWNDFETLFYMLPSNHGRPLRRYVLFFDYSLLEYYKRVD